MEELNAKLSYIDLEVDKNIEIIKSKEKHNKSLTGITGIFTIILSAAITLTLGLDIESFNLYQKNVALCLGAILTVANGWVMIFDYKKLWVRQKNTLLSLYQIRNKIGYAKECSNLTELEIEKLFAEYLDIWDKDSLEWESIHRIGKNSNTKKRDVR
jgi:hypothetical protein